MTQGIEKFNKLSRKEREIKDFSLNFFVNALFSALKSNMSEEDINNLKESILIKISSSSLSDIYHNQKNMNRYVSESLKYLYQNWYISEKEIKDAIHYLVLKEWYNILYNNDSERLSPFSLSCLSYSIYYGIIDEDELIKKMKLTDNSEIDDFLNVYPPQEIFNEIFSILFWDEFDYDCS